MKSRESNRESIVSELDELHAQLAEVRAESRRLANSRIATERKLQHIGKNLAGLKSQLAKTTANKAKSKR